MSNPWESSERETERRRRELASLQERRLAEFARKLRTIPLDLTDVEQVPREISKWEYERDQEAELGRMMARTVANAPRRGPREE